MSIKIHHGPPGSYKTSGAIADDMLQAIKAGRYIVTNIRGMSRDRVLQNLDDIPETFDLEFIDTSTSAGRDRLAIWFHWLPHGAYLFIDEAQSIWPKSWRDSDLAKLNYPGGTDKAKADDRPKDWADAFDQHRHYNWDICLTTPKISKIRDDIRGASECAFKHKNQAILGGLFKGKYIEGFHLADDNGSSANDFLSINNKKLSKKSVVWKLYDSTQTGLHQDTKAGLSIFKNPRVLLLLAGAAAAVLYAGTRDFSGVERLAGAKLDNQKPVQVTTASPVVVGAQAVPSDYRTFGAGVDVDSDKDFHPLGVLKIYISGTLRNALKTVTLYTIYSETGRPFTLTSLDLINAGYSVHSLNDCLSVLEYQKLQINVTCGQPEASAGERTGSPQPVGQTAVSLNPPQASNATAPKEPEPI